MLLDLAVHQAQALMISSEISSEIFLEAEIPLEEDKDQIKGLIYNTL